MTPRADCVIDARARTGEGAIWHGDALWWVDIPAGLLHRFEPESGARRTWECGRPLGCVAPKRSGGMIAALADGFHHLDLDSGALTPIADPEADRPENRFNDGAVDPRGRFYAGTMPIDGPSEETGPQGALYALGGERVRAVVGGLWVQNGLAFSPDGRTAYLSDTFPEVRTIWAFDYDPDDGAWTNRRTFFDTRAVDGRPDGAAIDAEGCYWMAGVGGWELVRITPAGDLDMRIPLPVEKPTRPAFGGRGLATLYVTSIGAGLGEGWERTQPQAGGVFALSVPGVVGLPSPAFDG